MTSVCRPASRRQAAWHAGLTQAALTAQRTALARRMFKDAQRGTLRRSQDELARRYGVCRASVNRVLQDLARAGLVVIIPQRGRRWRTASGWALARVPHRYRFTLPGESAESPQRPRMAVTDAQVDQGARVLTAEGWSPDAARRSCAQWLSRARRPVRDVVAYIRACSLTARLDRLESAEYWKYVRMALKGQQCLTQPL